MIEWTRSLDHRTGRAHLLDSGTMGLSIWWWDIGLCRDFRNESRLVVQTGANSRVNSYWPFLQKPSPQGLYIRLTIGCTSSRKTFFFYPLVFHRGDNSAGMSSIMGALRPLAVRRRPTRTAFAETELAFANHHVETIVSTGAVGNSTCLNLNSPARIA